MLRGECDHYWCNACLASLMEVYTRDESLHPLRCCQSAFQVTELSRRIKDRTLLKRFQSKRREYDVPAQDRVYCSRNTCSAFVGSAESRYPPTWFGFSRLWGFWGPSKLVAATCKSCRTVTCLACRKGAHPRDTCTQKEGADQVRALAQENGWQTCPKCSAVIELSAGCNHMTCRCRAQFCYRCGVAWKGCTCRQ